MWPARDGRCAGFEELGLKRYFGSRSCALEVSGALEAWLQKPRETAV